MTEFQRKGDARRYIFRQRRVISHYGVERLSKDVCKRLDMFLSDINYEFIHLYLQTGKEVSLDDFYKSLHKNKHIYTADMESKEVKFRSVEIVNGEFKSDKILENSPESIDIFLVPGLAFDKNFNRMGRGAGYYDRLLSSYSKALKIGLCFDYQLLPSIPISSHDVLMDVIVTESKILNKKIEQK